LTVNYLGVLKLITFTKQCCQRIGVLKKVFECLPLNCILLYYNAFIKSCFSYCTMIWFGNERSGRNKLINKINHLLLYLAGIFGYSPHDFVLKFNVLSVIHVYKLQCLSFMFDILHQHVVLEYLNFPTNRDIHLYNTRRTNALHVCCVTQIDKNNFPYNMLCIWNTYLDLNNLSKTALLSVVRYRLMSDFANLL
jgi:hypothetical protein